MHTVVSADVDSPVTGEWSRCSDDELEAELCGAAARVAAMTCRFLLAVAEYDRRQAWQAWECHDMAGWLSWKCGISPVTAREQVRVARALARLPVLRDRFAAGQVSYSQTRAIARVATAETEAQLVEWATVMTAAQLETVTRAYRRSAAAAQETAEARDLARGLTWSWDDDGSLIGRFRLPPEHGAALINAVTALVERAALDAADSEGAADPVAAVAADALVDLITAGAAATDRDTDDTGDDRYLVTSSPTRRSWPERTATGSARSPTAPAWPRRPPAVSPATPPPSPSPKTPPATSWTSAGAPAAPTADSAPPSNTATNTANTPDAPGDAPKPTTSCTGSTAAPPP